LSEFEEAHFRNGVAKQPESKPGGPRKKKQIQTAGVQLKPDRILEIHAFRKTFLSI